jgi:hypothetical protein
MIDYYFTLLSPWAYLGHAHFMTLAAKHHLTVRFRPVFLSDVFDETGGLPLAKRHPARQRYRILELQRWRDKRGLPLTIRPAFFPADPRLADRMTVALLKAGENPDGFIRACFEAIWVKDRNLADPAMLIELLTQQGFDADRIMADAQSDAIIAIYQNNVRQAIEAGVIGSPCYVHQGEVFWGQDRLELLEDAIVSGRAPYQPD